MAGGGGNKFDSGSPSRGYYIKKNDDQDLLEALRRLATPDNVIIPETGAGRYWYVDPRAGAPYNPASQIGYGDAQALDRLGVVPQGQNPFQF